MKRLKLVFLLTTLLGCSTSLVYGSDEEVKVTGTNGTSMHPSSRAKLTVANMFGMHRSLLLDPTNDALYAMGIDGAVAFSRTSSEMWTKCKPFFDAFKIWRAGYVQVRAVFGDLSEEDIRWLNFMGLLPETPPAKSRLEREVIEKILAHPSLCFKEDVKQVHGHPLYTGIMSDIFCMNVHSITENLSSCPPLMCRVLSAMVKDPRASERYRIDAAVVLSKMEDSDARSVAISVWTSIAETSGVLEEFRVEAALKLSKMEDPGARLAEISAWAAMAKDSSIDQYYRVNAASVLSKMKDPDARSVAISVLIAITEDSEFSQRHRDEAAAALSKMQAPGATSSETSMSH